MYIQFPQFSKIAICNADWEMINWNYSIHEALSSAQLSMPSPSPYRPTHKRWSSPIVATIYDIHSNPNVSPSTDTQAPTDTRTKYKIHNQKFQNESAHGHNAKLLARFYRNIHAQMLPAWICICMNGLFTHW